MMVDPLPAGFLVGTQAVVHPEPLQQRNRHIESVCGERLDNHWLYTTDRETAHDTRTVDRKSCRAYAQIAETDHPRHSAREGGTRAQLVVGAPTCS
jgi:hypothetical protein